MRCPACRHPAIEHDQACRECGFSLDALSPSMGIPPMLNAPLADLTGSLSGSERRSALRCIGTLHQRFPQLSFAAALMEVLPEMPMAIQAFWLFNRGSLFSAVERGGDNHGVLFLLDTSHNRGLAMIGYGLEPFVSEMTLEVCITAASISLSKGRHGAAIEAFVRELERQFTAIVHQLPRTFGYVDDRRWLGAVGGGGQDVVIEDGDSEDLY